MAGKGCARCLSRGSAYESLKQYERAIEDYDKAIELDPNYAFAYRNRAVSHDALGDAVAAAKDRAKADELKAAESAD